MSFIPDFFIKAKKLGESKTPFEPGEIIFVIDGSFTDFNGVVEEVD